MKSINRLSMVRRPLLYEGWSTVLLHHGCWVSAVAVVLGCLLALTRPAVALEGCVGDCDSDGTVAINELITGVNIALGNVFVDTCLGFDSSQNGTVAINELISGVNDALSGCLDLNANHVAIHDSASPDFDADCVSCHGEKPGEASLDPSIDGFHGLKLSSSVSLFIPGDTPNDKCVFCHADFDLSVNHSAGSFRRPVATATCAACHTSGPGTQFYQE